jgi:hypothetical protein
LRSPEEEMATERIERFFAPKGLHDSARGFNPGNRPKPHRALKGRHIVWSNNVSKQCVRRPFRCLHRLRFISVLKCDIGRCGSRSQAPLQGAWLGLEGSRGGNPGLSRVAPSGQLISRHLASIVNIHGSMVSDSATPELLRLLSSIP